MRMGQGPGWRSRAWFGMRQMNQRWEVLERDRWKISSGYIR
jgi:23S rRNA U2552 (ribose-2'-O)-methylase RlmE/FtsJ